MSGIVEQQLQNLDKQTLILLLRQTMASNAGLQKTVDQLNANISLLTEEVRSLRMHRFGRSSESNLTGTDGQMSFAVNEDGSIAFNEAESVTDAHPERVAARYTEIPDRKVHHVLPEPGKVPPGVPDGRSCPDRQQRGRTKHPNLLPWEEKLVRHRYHKRCTGKCDPLQHSGKCQGE